MGAPSPEAVRASAAARTVLVIGQATGCSVEVQPNRGRGGYATYRGRHQPGLVRLGNDVLTASAECQQWVGAHETAHLVRRHGKGRGAQVTVSIAFVAVVATTMLVGVSPTTSSSTGWVSLAVLAALGGSAFILLQAWCRALRRHEVEADDLATDWGYPVSPTVAAWLQSTEPRGSGSWLRRQLRTHPWPQERLARQRTRSAP